MLLGHETNAEGHTRPVYLPPKAWKQGVYLIGSPGAGKTSLMQNMAYQIMRDETNPSLICIDPHGDSIDRLIGLVPEAKKDNALLFAPGDKLQKARPLGLNIFDCDRTDEDQVRRVVSTVISTLYKLFAYSWGPRMEDLLRNSVLTLLDTPDTTFLDLLLLLTSTEHRSRYVENVRDPFLKFFWENDFAQYDKRMRAEVVGSSLNKIRRFLSDREMRNIIAQKKSGFALRELMDNPSGGLFFINLAKGSLGEDNSQLLGAMLVNLILIAALTRHDTDEELRHPVYVLVDEFQNFATSAFATLQSEARKYALNVLVAHQFRDQLDDEISGSTLNVTNFIVMRVSGRDSFDLAAQFDNTPPPADVKLEPAAMEHPDHPGFYVQIDEGQGGSKILEEREQARRAFSDVAAEKANQLSTLENYQAHARLLNENGNLGEYSIKTAPPMGEYSPEMANYIRQRSATFGVAREEIELELDNLIGADLDFI